jgi:hypothetical protein
LARAERGFPFFFRRRFIVAEQPEFVVERGHRLLGRRCGSCGRCGLLRIDRGFFD